MAVTINDNVALLTAVGDTLSVSNEMRHITAKAISVTHDAAGVIEVANAAGNVLFESAAAGAATNVFHFADAGLHLANGLKFQSGAAGGSISVFL